MGDGEARGEMTLSICSSIRGYHIYNAVWTTSIGEELSCEREVTNAADRYAIAVMNGSQVVGYLPRKISRLCSMFILRSGMISCIVSGPRRYSGDLPQGGLEVPCILLLRGKSHDLKKIKKIRCLIKEKL